MRSRMFLINHFQKRIQTIDLLFVFFFFSLLHQLQPHDRQNITKRRRRKRNQKHQSIPKYQIWEFWMSCPLQPPPLHLLLLLYFLPLSLLKRTLFQPLLKNRHRNLPKVRLFYPKPLLLFLPCPNDFLPKNVPPLLHLLHHHHHHPLPFYILKRDLLLVFIHEKRTFIIHHK